MEIEKISTEKNSLLSNGVSSLSFSSKIGILVLISIFLSSISLNIFLLVEKYHSTTNSNSNVLESGLTAQGMADLWNAHTYAEFAIRSTNATMVTVTQNFLNMNIPTLYGGDGYNQAQNFYSTMMIPCNPPDIATSLISRTIGDVQLVDELNLTFTHTTLMPWLLPNIPPTGKFVNVPVTVIVSFEDGLISGEHIYWDQASVLYQVGLINKTSCSGGFVCPISGSEQSHMTPIHW